jgi:hypothetical protein
MGRLHCRFGIMQRFKGRGAVRADAERGEDVLPFKKGRRGARIPKDAQRSRPSCRRETEAKPAGSQCLIRKCRRNLR